MRQFGGEACCRPGKARDLTRLRPQFALCALSVSVVLAGCTNSVLDADLGLEPQLSMAAADPALPEEVAALPTAAPAAEAQAAEAQAAGEALPAFEPVAFAGPTPDKPLAAAMSPTGKVAPRSPELDALIAKYALHHGIPLELLRRVVKRESTFNPTARNGPYWGLMQILPQTARTMGYKGTPDGLLDAETNLIYAGKYLRGAYLVAGGDHDLAVRFYSRGYYYDAKRRGMLEATGLGNDRRRMR
jgi:soluble lytic murein transglycosylase-like protein